MRRPGVFGPANFLLESPHFRSSPRESGDPVWIPACAGMSGHWGSLPIDIALRRPVRFDLRAVIGKARLRDRGSGAGRQVLVIEQVDDR
jgi:hypothetical protein